MKLISEISMKEFPTIRIGHAEEKAGKTGVTVLLFQDRAVTGIDISGGGPASRETPLLNPMMACESIHSIVLSGGSAYGLEASSGVMRYLEEQGIGFDTGFAKVPLVCQSCIYDLSYGCSDIRPTAQLGYQACQKAFVGNEEMGNVGAGTGATVGKLTTMKRSMKSGLGLYACQVGEIKVGAIVVVNALGDVLDYKTGEKLAGMRNETRTDFTDIEEEMYRGIQAGFSGETAGYTTNTTIGAVFTNGKFTKAEMNKIASMTRNAYAKCISPVGTTADGDTIYATSVGEVTADLNMVGTLASRAMGEAIKRAIQHSQMEEEEYLRNCLELS